MSWNFKVTKPGKFSVQVTYSCAAPGSEFVVEAGKEKLTGKSQSTGSWATYATATLGTLTLAAGPQTLAVKPKAEPKWKVIGLKSVILNPTEKE